MITERDLQEAIAECQGQRNPDSSTCIKLAAFYTIRDHLFPEEKTEQAFTYAPPPNMADVSVIDFPGESEFAAAVDGKRQRDVLPIIEDLMFTLETINPPLYQAVMRKIR